MRIGKFNQIINNAIDANGTLQTGGSPRLGGQVFVIENFNKKADLILTLRDMNMLPEDITESVIDIFENKKNAITAEVESVQHAEIVSLFTQINMKLPVYSEIADNFSPNQEETAINIKLPSNINSINDLSVFNKRLDNIFKKINITGNFKITGFDTGSEWYQVLIDNAVLFNYVISAVSLSLQIIDFRNKRKGSDDLRLTKKAIDVKNPSNTITEQKLLNGMVDEKISEDVNKIIEELDCPDGREKPETISMIIGAVKELIREIDRGTEFHLSLNPPEYVKENGGNMMINIDYNLIPKLNKPKDSPKHIEGAENINNDLSDELS